ncbi:MAG: hypothetical protein OCD76_14255 [Reichenbachiella sp.]
MKLFTSILGLLISTSIIGQETTSKLIDSLTNELAITRQTELVQSMSQRSIIMPSYQSELKALIAKQAYNIWSHNEGEKLVSHKNVYSALYDANKYLEYDSITFSSYNQAIGHSESVTSIILGNQPNEFYSAGSDGKVLKWNLSNIKSIPETLYEGQHLIKSIDLSFDEKIMLINTKGNGVIFLDLEGSNEIKNISSNDPEEFQEVTFFPNEYKYLGINAQGQIRIKGFSIDSTYDKRFMTKFNSMIISDNAKTVYLGSESGHLKIIEEQEDYYYAIPELFSINALAISPNQKMLAVGREKGDALIIDLEKNIIKRTISGHQSAVTDVDFSHDNLSLLTASRDGTARIWNTNDSRKLPIILDDHEDWVFTASFTQDGSHVITGSKDSHIRIFNMDFEWLANRICSILDRNLTIPEWNEYIGENVPYSQTCETTE